MADQIITIPPERVLSLIQEHLRRGGVSQPIVGIQICVEQPFDADAKVHNEVPRLNVILPTPSPETDPPHPSTLKAGE